MIMYILIILERVLIVVGGVTVGFAIFWFFIKPVLNRYYKKKRNRDINKDIKAKVLHTKWWGGQDIKYPKVSPYVKCDPADEIKEDKPDVCKYNANVRCNDDIIHQCDVCVYKLVKERDILTKESEMNKEELISELKKCFSNDEYTDHVRADKLLLKFIDDKDIEKAFNAIPKFYS